MFNEAQCNKCAAIGTPYVQFYESSTITEASNNNKALPKYGFHLSAVCPECGNFIKHLKQSDTIVGRKFILIPES